MSDKELLPFSGAEPVCSKCASTTIETMFSAGGVQETLVRICECGFQWWEHPADHAAKVAAEFESVEPSTLVQRYNALLQVGTFIYANPDLFEELGEEGQTTLRAGLGFDGQWNLPGTTGYDGEAFLCQTPHAETGVYVAWTGEDLRRFGCPPKDGKWKCPDCGTGWAYIGDSPPAAKVGRISDVPEGGAYAEVLKNWAIGSGVMSAPREAEGE